VDQNPAQLQQVAATQTTGERSVRRTAETVPGCIKLIILAVLLALLAAEIGSGFQTARTQSSRASETLTSNFGTFIGDNWLLGLIILITILLIILILILMRVQRSLTCEITAPTGCVTARPQQKTDNMGQIVWLKSIDVMGTAAGTVFGHYTLTGVDSMGHPMSISYPPPGFNGSTPVNGGVLGTIHADTVSDGVCTLTLKVYPAGAGTPCIYTSTFKYLDVDVFIKAIRGIDVTPSQYDPKAEIEVGVANVISIGSDVYVQGAAYIHGCDDRKISSYDLRYAQITDLTMENTNLMVNPGPGDNMPIPAIYSGIIAHVEWTHDTETPVLSDDQYKPWLLLGPNDHCNLVNSWVQPPAVFNLFGWTYVDWVLAGGEWGTTTVTGLGNSGRYSLLVSATDTVGNIYNDIQKVWVDNWPVLAYITRLQIPDPTPTDPNHWKDLPPCTDILVSWKKLRILGVAWDRVIDGNFDKTLHPNDNFAQYILAFYKQFDGGTTIKTDTQRVILAGTPTDADPGPIQTNPYSPAYPFAAELGIWDLTALDAGHNPGDTCTSPPEGGGTHAWQLYRGCACTYDITLHVDDNTYSDDYFRHHPDALEVPVKVINDLKPE
jgi:hypothetical protein